MKVPKNQGEMQYPKPLNPNWAFERTYQGFEVLGAAKGGKPPDEVELCELATPRPKYFETKLD